MVKFEHTNDIVANMSGCSTPLSEPDLKTTSSDQPMQKIVPYHHPHHKNRRMWVALLIHFVPID
jgi:hypothetical protein